MGQMRNSYKILVHYLKGRDHSQDLGIDRRIILEWMSETRVGGCGLMYLAHDRVQ
jgi:hypothetical protein